MNVVNGLEIAIFTMAVVTRAAAVVLLSVRPMIVLLRTAH